MNAMMVVGLGSMGRRHLRDLTATQARRSPYFNMMVKTGLYDERVLRLGEAKHTLAHSERGRLCIR